MTDQSDEKPVRGPAGRLFGVVATLVGAVGLLFAGQYAWTRYSQRYVVERTDDGAAITKIVAARFVGASALKVGSLSGLVQSTASDVTAYGMLHSDKVVKAPFTVDYFVDVSKLGQGDLSWNGTTRTLMVEVPDVTVGAANVDESAQTLSETRGLFVTREAADRMSQAISQRAQTSASVEARKPERLSLARDNARTALGKLLSGPLAAAGYGDVRVVLAFPWEGRRTPEEWERSRNLKDVAENRF